MILGQGEIRYCCQEHQQHRQQNREDSQRERRRIGSRCRRQLLGDAAQLHFHFPADEFSKQRSRDGGRGESDQQRIENGFAHVGFACQLVENSHGGNRAWMRRHQAVHHGKTGHQRYGDTEQGRAGFARESEHDRNQQHQSNGKEHGNADDKSDKHHGPVKPLFAQRAHQSVRHDFRPAGFRQHFAQNRSQPNDHGDVAEHLADPFQETFGNVR